MLFRKIKDWFRRRKSDEEVVAGYLKHGGAFGDAVSYIYMGECLGFADLLARWAEWEREFAHRGYRTLSIDDFVDYGGWGKRPEGFPAKRGPDEEPVFHAELYRERYLGRIRPTLDLDALMRGEAQSGTYAIPSTEDAKKSPTEP